MKQNKTASFKVVGLNSMFWLRSPFLPKLSRDCRNSGSSFLDGRGKTYNSAEQVLTGYIHFYQKYFWGDKTIQPTLMQQQKNVYDNNKNIAIQ